MSKLREKLDLADEQAKKNEPLEVSVREFLGWFGYERRGWRVIRHIRTLLNDRDLTTQPNFEHTWFDGPITLVRRKGEAERKKDEATESELGLSNSVEVTVSEELVGGAIADPAFRIGKLDAANNPPQRIAPDATVQQAITVMLRDNFSQLPVMTTEREVKGAITWQSIAKRAGLGHQCETVKDCMDPHVEIVVEDDSLFRVIERIKENDFVLVQSNDKRIIGIITVADLSETLDELGRPFLLLSEIENHIRGLIDGRFTEEELKTVKNPDDTEREVNDVSDLTFGEYVRLIQNPKYWGKLGLPIDRGTFVTDMERVNLIRNDVMHFDPDGIGNEDLETLRKSARFVQDLSDLAMNEGQCNE